MNYKTTIAAVAISASSAFGLVGPGSELKTICLSAYSDANGVLYAGSCDESSNNQELKKPLLANGCAEGQISITAYSMGNNFNVQVEPCLPPNVVQL